MLTKEDFESYSGKESFKKVVNSNITKKNYDSLIETVNYESELLKLQAELVDLQQWTAKHKKRVCVLFEGRCRRKRWRYTSFYRTLKSTIHARCSTNKTYRN